MAEKEYLDRLVESLRLCVKYGKAQDALENAEQAADAIEELQKAVLRLEEASGILDELPMYQQPVGWIPVTERLPEDLTRAIVFCEDGVSFGLCEHLIADDTEVVEWHDFLHYPITPTHWMPLPQPPKEE